MIDSMTLMIDIAAGIVVGNLILSILEAIMCMIFGDDDTPDDTGGNDIC